MKRTMMRLLAAASVLMTVAFGVVVVGQTAQVVELADRLHPVAGSVVLWGLIALYLACIAVPLFLIFRLPKPLIPPETDRGPAFDRHLERLRGRLRRNPRLAGRSLETRAEIDDALDSLDGVVEELLRTAGGRVFVSTAISQNGALDSLLVLGVQSKLVWDVARVYHQRPSLRDLAYLYANVATTAFLAGELEDADISEQLQPVLSSVLGSAAGAVPGLQVASSLFVNSVFSGSANAFLTLRVGFIAREYSRALARPEKRSLRRSAAARAARMLGSIARAGASRVSKAIVAGSRRRMSDAVTGLGSRVREAGGGLLDRISADRGEDDFQPSE